MTASENPARHLLSEVRVPIWLASILVTISFGFAGWMGLRVVDMVETVSLSVEQVSRAVALLEYRTTQAEVTIRNTGDRLSEANEKRRQIEIEVDRLIQELRRRDRPPPSPYQPQRDERGAVMPPAGIVPKKEG